MIFFHIWNHKSNIELNNEMNTEKTKQWSTRQETHFIKENRKEKLEGVERENESIEWYNIRSKKNSSTGYYFSVTAIYSGFWICITELMPITIFDYKTDYQALDINPQNSQIHSESGTNERRSQPSMRMERNII